MISAKFLTLETSATGTNFVTLPDAPCSVLEVFNGTGTDLTFRHVHDEDEVDFVLKANLAFAFRGITNANQLKVKRTDESNTIASLKSVEVRL